MTASAATSRNKKVLEILLKAGVIRSEHVDGILRHVQRYGDRVEEVIIALSVAAEPEILKALAAAYKTRFITTEKLSKAEIDQSTLQLLPRRYVERTVVFPVMYDARTLLLSVVSADPDDPQLVDELKLASGAKEVRAFVARPAAVKAAIARAYGGDAHAFVHLEKRQADFDSTHTIDSQQIVESSITLGRASAVTEGVQKQERFLTAAQLRQATMVPPSAPMGPAAGISDEELLELLKVMMSMIESERPDLRGHSVYVARLVHQMCERVKADRATRVAAVAAGYLHDLGKAGTYHLTALNCAEYEGHRAAAQKTCSVPARLLQPVRLPEEAITAISSMYERFDGKGFPEGTAGKEIAAGARILAIVDTYADLVQNARNPFRKALSPQEAVGVLAKYKDSIFDPNLVDLFRLVVLGEDLRAKLLANRYEALIVDQDSEETTVLELRMLEQGFVVKLARRADEALKLLAEREFDLVVSELDLPDMDGLAFLAQARKQVTVRDVAWVVYTRRQGRTEPQKAIELGALDYVLKPAPAEVLVAKFKAILDQRAQRRGSRGVSGSLREMGLPDMVQVLSNGRKSGNLKIRLGNDAGEIHFIDGQIVQAVWGNARGEEAFFAMLKLNDGEFGLDPAFKAPVRAIQVSSEALLLEGMRRMDEGVG